MVRYRFAGLVLLLVVGLSCAEDPAGDAFVSGQWGGEGILIEVRDGRTLFYLACADGVVDGTIVLDNEGRFSIAGTIAVGPVVRDMEEARFSGQVVGDSLTVTITIADTGASVGTFSAERDRSVQLVQCR